MELKDQLEAKRDKYVEEGSWLKFLIDSWTGGGGYQGRVKQPPSGYWGSAAEAYAQFATLSSNAYFQEYEFNTYLDRYPREDAEKFQRRINVAHYLNYVRPITNLLVSYLLRKPHKWNNLPKEIESWIEETSYTKGNRLRALRAVVCGWAPVQVDMPARPETAVTQADVGNLSPYLIELLPCHLYDYGEDERGQFTWVKLCVSFRRKDTWNGEELTVKRYTIWTREEFFVYEMIRRDNGDEIIRELTKGTHPFKAVPLVIFRSSVSLEDSVKSDSLIADIALEGRRLFNLISELDEHLRGQVFALLCIPKRVGEDGEAPAAVGTENALIYDPESSTAPSFLAPPPTVAATYEKRIEATIVEMYRIARVEYTRASGANQSAESRKTEFEQTNLAIADLASSLARAERDLFILVGRGLGLSEDRLQAIQVIPAESFDTEELNDEIERLVTLLTVRELGRTFRVELLQRIAQRVLPNLNATARKVMLDEIEKAVARAEQEAELMREREIEGGGEPGGDDAGGGGDGDGEEPSDDNEDQDEAS